METHPQRYFKLVADVAVALDAAGVERLVQALVELRARGGRLFLLGVGGSAANCSHAVNDFRKLAGIGDRGVQPLRQRVGTHGSDQR